MKEQLAPRIRENAAFNPEYTPDRFDAELQDEIISYLGEYRFQLKKFDYDLVYGTREDGAHIRDPHRKEAMLTKASRSIAERKKHGLPTHREEAEKAGLERLDQLLSTTSVGDTILWGSPPGPKEEGYGGYGFIYAGEVVSASHTGKQIKMMAFRVEHPTISQYNSVFTFLTRTPYSFSNVDEFLAYPVVKSFGIEKQFVERVLAGMFVMRKDSQDIFRWAMQILDPLIGEFIAMRNYSSREEKLKALHTLENYSLELKNRYDGASQEQFLYLDKILPVPLNLLSKAYGYEPPRVVGSCGDTKKAMSNNVLENNYEKMMKMIFGEEWFTCPSCGHKADGPVGNRCPGCGITKEDYAKESGAELCD